MKEKIKFSASKVQTFLHCRKRYWWIYHELLVPKTTAMPLQIGVIVHRLLHAYYSKKLTAEMINDLPRYIASTFKENTEDLSDEVGAEAARLFMGYLNRWSKDNLNVIASEVWVEAEMPNFILRGRVDAIARTENDKLWRFEHKTAARMDSAYLNGLKGGIQGTIYDFLVEYLFKEQVQGTIYNILVKTKIPAYERSFARSDTGMRARVFDTLEGIVRSVERGDFYPSSQCFQYNSICAYKPLCDFDSTEVREAFYVPKPPED